MEDAASTNRSVHVGYRQQRTELFFLCGARDGQLDHVGQRESSARAWGMLSFWQMLTLEHSARRALMA